MEWCGSHDWPPYFSLIKKEKESKLSLLSPPFFFSCEGNFPSRVTRLSHPLLSPTCLYPHSISPFPSRFLTQVVCVRASRGWGWKKISFVLPSLSLLPHSHGLSSLLSGTHGCARVSRKSPSSSSLLFFLPSHPRLLLPLSLAQNGKFPLRVSSFSTSPIFPLFLLFHSFSSLFSWWCCSCITQERGDYFPSLLHPLTHSRACAWMHA